ncbi:MAG: non-hydrolyzing UDP-N-acetylglucosamine 2-epimerase [Bacteroidales bacterium]
MIHLINVIGARPQIIKAAAIHRAIANHFREQIREVIVHTGQHYDHNMSRVFFEELGIPQEDVNLEVGSLSHAKQTAAIMTRMEDLLLEGKPDAVVVYGDTNSTLAASLAAAKIHIPVIHIEAGLRSFNKTMPEEINRLVCDQVSTLLFAPTKTAVDNLVHEGFEIESGKPYSIDRPGIFLSGDVMFDNTLYFGTLAEQHEGKLNTFGLRKGEYALVTIHRDNNTDDPRRLSQIFQGILELSETAQLRCLVPLHPRTAKILNSSFNEDLLKNIRNSRWIRITEPLSFLEMSLCEKYARIVLTDSGGVQKEAFFHRKPCVILRSETEWVEIVASGTAALADADTRKIVELSLGFLKNPPQEFPAFFGEGDSAGFICRKIIDSF